MEGPGWRCSHPPEEGNHHRCLRGGKVPSGPVGLAWKHHIPGGKNSLLGRLNGFLFLDIFI